MRWFRSVTVTVTTAVLAVTSVYSRPQRAALAFIKFLTSLSSERQVLVAGSLPPVWTVNAMESP